MKTILFSLLIAASLSSCSESAKLEKGAAEQLKTQMLNPEAFELIDSKLVDSNSVQGWPRIRVRYKAASRNGFMIEHTTYMVYSPNLKCFGIERD